MIGVLAFFVVGVILVYLGIRIYRGETNLIQFYHQRNVGDKRGYGRAVGRILILWGFMCAFQGVLLLIFDNYGFVVIAPFVIWSLVSLVMFFVVQRKYNGGMF